MIETVDYIVMGAGVIGLSAALALQQRGHSVLVLEAGALYDKVSKRVYALNLASQELFQHLGIWEKVAPVAAPYERMHVWDAQSSAKIAFDARLLARDRLGVILEEHYLIEALLQQIRERDIPVVTDWETKDLRILDDHVKLCSAQQEFQTAFMLITEGSRSTTRDLLRVPMAQWSYQQRAIVATVRVEKPHAKTAYQVFCPQGPLAFLPMADSQHCAIVWSTAVPHAEALMALPDEDFSQELAAAFEKKLGKVTLLSSRHSFPLQMQHVHQYADTRWAIMGDAAHTIHPLAGLGLNLGLADLTAFLNLLQQQSSAWLSRRALQAYQRQRKSELWQTILFLQGMHRLFTYTNVPSKILRRTGLQICDRLPILKRILIEHASGV